MRDLRTSRRFPVQLPVRILDGEEIAGSTDNISAAGCYLHTSRAFEKGASIRFAITVPGEYTGSQQDAKVRCEGVVQRTDRLDEGLYGIACTLDSYEFVRDEAKE